MIQLKKRYSNKDWRLFDTETNKYVKNNAENRNRAMICLLIDNEIKKEDDNKNAVEEIIWTYYKALEATKSEPLNLKTLNQFLLKLDEKLSLIDFENMQKLTLCVLKDQKDESTAIKFEDIEKFAEEYNYMNEKILNQKTFEL